MNILYPPVVFLHYYIIVKWATFPSLTYFCSVWWKKEDKCRPIWPTNEVSEWFLFDHTCFSYIIVCTRDIPMLWWCPSCTRLTCCASSLNQQPTGRHISPPDHVILSQPVFFSYSLKLHAHWRSSKFQF